jgi:H+/Cl- antiporter ClcA
MNRLISLVFLIIGAVLIVYGISASDSVGSHFSRFFTGSPTDKTIWLLAGGAIAAIVGFVGILRSPNSS